MTWENPTDTSSVLPGAVPDLDGGSAFPSGNGSVPWSAGMSLRDWFAGQALHGAVTLLNQDRWAEPPNVARIAYAVADAMLKARKEQS